MKIFVFFIIFFGLCNIVYSIENNPGIETIGLQIKIPNLYEDISTSNIKIYDPTNTRIIVPFNLYKIDNENYFLAFYLDSNFSSGNYSVLIQNHRIITNNILKERNYTYIKWVDRTNSSLKIDPAIVFLEESNTPFDIFVSSYNYANLSVDVNLIIQPNTEVLGDNVLLASIDSKKLEPYKPYNIEVIVKNVKSRYIGKLILDIGEKKYQVDIYSKKYFALDDYKNQSIKHIVFLNDKDYINLSFFYGETIFGGGGEIVIENDGDFPIDRINIGLNGNLADIMRLSNLSIAGLDKGNKTSFSAYINEDLSAKQGFYHGNITIFYDTGEINMPVYINILSKPVMPVENITDNLIENSTNNTITQTGDNTIKTPLIILISILLLVFVLIFLFFRKGKKKIKLDDNSKFDQIISKYESK